MTTPVDPQQLAAATKALLASIHGEQEKKSSLLDEDSFVLLVISLKKTPEKARVRPFRAPLAHSLYKDKSICLITPDGKHKAIKEHLKENPVEGVEKVLSFSKLKKNYKRFDERRKLLAEYDLFLADERLKLVLPKAVGVKFFEKKKHPMLVSLERKDVKPSILRARDSTQFHLRAGPSMMVKIGRTNFSDKQIAENFFAAIGAIVEQIPQKWKNVQALYLRTATSVALPFYHALPTTTKIDSAGITDVGSKRKDDSTAAEAGVSKKAKTVPQASPSSSKTTQQPSSAALSASLSSSTQSSSSSSLARPLKSSSSSSSSSSSGSSASPFPSPAMKKKIEAFNAQLANLPEHYDLPKSAKKLKPASTTGSEQATRLGTQPSPPKTATKARVATPAPKVRTGPPTKAKKTPKKG